MHPSGHPAKIALAVALVAAPLAWLRPSAEWVRVPMILAADAPAPPSNVNGKPLTNAPLSRLGPPGGSPASEPAVSGFHSDQAGPLDSTPFSAAGSGTLSNDGTDADRSFTSTDKTGAVPNLGR